MWMMVIIREIRWIKNINFICSQSSLKDNVKHTKKLKSLFEEKKKKTQQESGQAKSPNRKELGALCREEPGGRLLERKGRGGRQGNWLIGYSLKPSWCSGKESACNAGDAKMRVQSLVREDPLE